MRSRIRNIFHMTANMKTQSISMRRKLMLYWMVMILTSVFLLLSLLSITGAFSRQDQKLKQSLELHLDHTGSAVSEHMERLLAQSVILSEQISREVQQQLTLQGKTVEELNDSPELLEKLQMNLYDKLNTVLLVSECSGAYFVLDVTTNTNIEAADYSRSGMYLRYANLNAKGVAVQDIVYFRGIPEIARKEQVQLHNRWNLEFNSMLLPNYERILNQQNVKDLAQASCWSSKVRLTDTWENVILLSVPILDSKGTVIGVCGVEISELYFYLSYPAMDSPFGMVNTVFAPMEQEQIDLRQGIIASKDTTNIEDFAGLKIRRKPYYNVYETENETYLGLHREVSVGASEQDQVGVAILLKKYSYDDVMRRNRWGTLAAFLIVFLILLGVSMLLTHRFMKPISHSMQALQREDVSDVHHSGIYEIDWLMEAIQSKSNPVGHDGIDPKLEELLTSFREALQTLTVSERRILTYYIEGNSAAEISEKAFISMSTVRKHSGNIYRKLNISSREELMLYVELFRRCDRMEDLL